MCDNIDLDSMYLEYCSLFQIKFGKKPRILKRIDAPNRSSQQLTTNRQTNAMPRQQSIKKEPSEATCTQVQDMEGVLKISSTTGSPPVTSSDQEMVICNETKPPSMVDFDCFPEDWKDIVENICRMIVHDTFDINWSNVHGSHLAKNVLRESVILPLQRPDLFKSIRPWRSVLLHGPPGTGKTLMAKALAAECAGRVTFFNVHSSLITSKWRGESEKYLRVLFEVARQYSPSIIFIDEIEGLTTSRDSSSDYESSRRFKNELLTLMDGLDSSVYSGVFLLCNTNLPWLIDEAFLRRFEQKILISVPTLEDRIELLRQFIPATRTWPEANLQELALISEGFTGDDIRLIGKQTDMIQIRKALHQSGGHLISPGETVNYSELKATIAQFRSSSGKLLEKHIEWSRKNGSYDTIM